MLRVISSGFTQLTKWQREQLVNTYFANGWMLTFNNMTSTFIPVDFMPLLGKAMSVLSTNDKDNLFYHAAKCFGEQRPGTNYPRMPLNRMPIGLIAHNLKFFASDNVCKLQAPDDYKSWCQSMYTLFGNKWASMHLGPMWSYKVEDEGDKTGSELTQGQSSSLDILSQALQQTFGADSELFQMAAGTCRGDGQGTGTILNEPEYLTTTTPSDESSDPGHSQPVNLEKKMQVGNPLQVGCC